MEFRVRNKEGELLSPHGLFLSHNGKIYSEGLFGIEELKGAKIEYKIGTDVLGNSIFENDILLSQYSVYTAGFDLEMGAVLISENGGKIPFKHSVEKLVLKELK